MTVRKKDYFNLFKVFIFYSESQLGVGRSYILIYIIH